MYILNQIRQSSSYYQLRVEIFEFLIGVQIVSM